MKKSTENQPKRKALPTDWEVHPVETDEEFYSLANNIDLDRPESFLHIKKRHVQAVRRACGRNNAIDFMLYGHLCNLSHDGKHVVCIKSETLASDLSLSDLDNMRKHLNFLHNSGLITKDVETHRRPIRENGRFVRYKETPTSNLRITVHMDHPAVAWAEAWERGEHRLTGDENFSKPRVNREIDSGFDALRNAVDALDPKDVSDLLDKGGFGAVLAVALGFDAGSSIASQSQQPSDATEVAPAPEKPSEAPSDAFDAEIEALAKADLKCSSDKKYRAELSEAWSRVKSEQGAALEEALRAYGAYIEQNGFLKPDGSAPEFAKPMPKWLEEPSGFAAYRKRCQGARADERQEPLPDEMPCPQCEEMMSLVDPVEKRYGPCPQCHSMYRLEEIRGIMKVKQRMVHPES